MKLFEFYRAVPEASYEGNIGLMELMNFLNTATQQQIDLFDRLVANKDDKKVWELVQKVTGTKLVGKQFESVSYLLENLELDNVEKFAQRIFGPSRISLKFTNHLKDRFVDERNDPPIRPAELVSVFKRIQKQLIRKLVNIEEDTNIIVQDKQTGISISFKYLTRANGSKILTATTIIRDTMRVGVDTEKFIIEDMNIPREKMPQLDIEDLEQHYNIKRGMVSISKLSTSQEERIPEKVDDIKEKILNGEEIAPIIIDKNGYVVDGHHRYTAYEELGVNKISADMIKDATVVDLIKRYQHKTETNDEAIQDNS